MIRSLRMSTLSFFIISTAFQVALAGIIDSGGGDPHLVNLSAYPSPSKLNEAVSILVIYRGISLTFSSVY